MCPFWAVDASFFYPPSFHFLKSQLKRRRRASWRHSSSFAPRYVLPLYETLFSPPPNDDDKNNNTQQNTSNCSNSVIHSCITTPRVTRRRPSGVGSALRREVICSVWDALVATARAFVQTRGRKVWVTKSDDGNGGRPFAWVTLPNRKKTPKNCQITLSATFTHPAGCHFIEISQADGSHFVEIEMQLNCRWRKTFFFSLSQLKA